LVCACDVGDQARSEEQLDKQSLRADALAVDLKQRCLLLQPGDLLLNQLSA
jgi:hypothetical protein